MPSEGMNIEPIHCRAGDIRPGLTCDVSCWNNYVFSQPTIKTIHVTCKRDGMWTRSVPKCIPTEMYLVCPPDQTLQLPPTESILWHQLDIVNSSDYATSFTPVRKAANGRLEFQFGLGRSQVFVTSQSRLTGEGGYFTYHFCRLCKHIFSEKMLDDSDGSGWHAPNCQILSEDGGKVFAIRSTIPIRSPFPGQHRHRKIRRGRHAG